MIKKLINKLYKLHKYFLNKKDYLYEILNRPFIWLGFFVSIFYVINIF